MTIVDKTIDGVKASAKLSDQLAKAVISKGVSNPNVPLNKYAGGIQLLLAKRNNLTVRELLATYCLESLVEACLDIYYNEYAQL